MDSTVAVGPQLLTEREAAKRLAISQVQLAKLRKAGQIRHIRLAENGRIIHYCPADLTAWIDRRATDGKPH